MIVIYYFLMWVFWFLLAPIFFILSCFKDKYKQSLKARFFLYHNLKQKPADVHFHVCSFGEAKSIKELSQKFDSRISVITQTGFELAKTFCSKVNYLAFETFLPFWLKPCKTLVIFEAEYWLMLVFVAKFKGAKVMLINARISDKSYKSYLRFAFFYRVIFSYIDEVFAQSEQDKMRLMELGAKNIKIYPNIKANLEIKPSKTYEKFKEKLIIFASTHENEEELLLDHVKLRTDEKLIIAPRHPERFERVANLLSHLGLEFQRFSHLKQENFNDEFRAQILLLDTLGELVNFYAISDIVVLGGSFFEGIGGHNPIEVAYFNNALISGQFIHNQTNLFSKLENVYFCKEIQNLDTQIHGNLKQVKMLQNRDLSPIISAIQGENHARKSL